MRYFYVECRMYRRKDEHYWTFGLTINCSSLGDCGVILEALDVGVRTASLDELHTTWEDVSTVARRNRKYYNFTEFKVVELIREMTNFYIVEYQPVEIVRKETT